MLPARIARTLLVTLAVCVAPCGYSAAFELEEATIASVQQAIQGKRITSEQLVRQYFERIKSYNGTCVRQPQGVLGPLQRSQTPDS
jgi:hypothetical protein